MREAEHNLQCACVRWFRLTRPEGKIVAIPNGGQRNPITGAKLKAEGVTAGFPDLFCPMPAGGYHGLFIEMKVQGGRLQTSQKEMLAYLDSQGYKTAVCYDFDEFCSTINNYLGLSR